MEAGPGAVADDGVHRPVRKIGGDARLSRNRFCHGTRHLNVDHFLDGQFQWRSACKADPLPPSEKSRTGRAARSESFSLSCPHFTKFLIDERQQACLRPWIGGEPLLNFGRKSSASTQDISVLPRVVCDLQSTAKFRFRYLTAGAILRLLCRQLLEVIKIRNRRAAEVPQAGAAFGWSEP